MLTVTVTEASAGDRARVVSAIVMAFARDPISRWSWPEPHDFLTHFPALVDAFGGRAFEHGTAHQVEGFAGASLWLPPGVTPDEARLVHLAETTLPPARAATALAMFEQMAAYHPHEPHWYLPLIGVDPALQGRGYGSALLRHVLERVDREGGAAYLESSNPANIPLYERHGFVVAGTIQLNDAPPIYPMVRRAR